MIHKDDIEQARANTLKVVRTAIRLKHSIAADEELNDVLPRAQAKFDAAVNRGVLPAPIDVKKALGI